MPLIAKCEDQESYSRDAEPYLEHLYQSITNPELISPLKGPLNYVHAHDHANYGDHPHGDHENENVLHLQESEMPLIIQTNKTLCIYIHTHIDKVRNFH